MFVQFSDSTEATIVSLFGCAQDPKTFPNQGTVEADDPRYLTYYKGQPWFAQAEMPEPTSDAS